MRTFGVQGRRAALREPYRFVLLSLFLLGVPRLANAADPEATPATEPAAAEPAAAEPAAAEPAPRAADPESVPPPASDAKPKPPPYSLPWQLRPVAPGNVLRLDTAFASYKNPTTGKTGGTAIATSILGSYKVI